MFTQETTSYSITDKYTESSGIKKVRSMGISDYSDEKTLYTITDEHREKSTITVEKWAADLLQDRLTDVHAWFQEIFKFVCEKKPHLGRVQKGNVVRNIAYREAKKHPAYVPLANLL